VRADCVVVAGFPSSGKSAVVRWLGRRAVRSARRPAVAALECFPAEPRPAWTVAGPRPVPWRRWTSGDTCPDHALALVLPEMRDWAAGAGADLLLVESAGLCCRCSPYPFRCAAVFVADAAAGRGALGKVGPMLTTCDLCVLTRPDRVTPAERELLLATARDLGRAAVLALDGLTGEGSDVLWRQAAALLDRPGTESLRADLPQFYCSYCLGRERVGILDL
jgi:Ni2+-binding GTPase involved in maturation of urease and hydrogenase